MTAHGSIGVAPSEAKRRSLEVNPEAAGMMKIRREPAMADVKDVRKALDSLSIGSPPKKQRILSQDPFLPASRASSQPAPDPEDLARKVRPGFPFKAEGLSSHRLNEGGGSKQLPWGNPMDSETFRNRIINCSKVSVNTGVNGLDTASPFLQFSGNVHTASTEAPACTALVLYQSPDTVISQSICRAAKEAQKAKQRAERAARDSREHGTQQPIGATNWNLEDQSIITPKDFGVWSWADLKTNKAGATDGHIAMETEGSNGGRGSSEANACSANLMQCDGVGSVSVDSSYRKWEEYVKGLDADQLDLNS